MTGQPIYMHFSDVSKCWQKKQVLDSVSIELQGGECTLISGDNGSGKSTLLRILAGLLKPDQATVGVCKHLRSWARCRKILRQRTMYLHQTPYLFDGTVRKNLSLVRSHRDIDEAMTWADISHLADQPVHGLSGGERQRVALARAWLKHPDFLFLDEPTANLDQESRHRTVDLLCSLKDQGVAILVASHDPSHFSKALSKHLHLKDGRIQTSSNLEKDCKLVTLFPKEA